MRTRHLLFELAAALLSMLCTLGIQAYQSANYSPVPTTTINNFTISVFLEPGEAVSIHGMDPPVANNIVQWPDGTIVISAITGHDRNGLSADFKIVVVSQEYGWELESATKVVDLDGQPFDLIGYLETKGLQNDLGEAEDLIAIGAASCEGTFRREIRRAEERAMSLVAWLRQVRPTGSQSQGLYTLNLGRHNASCDGESTDATIHQRLITIVWVPKKDADVRLTEALYDAMTNLGTKGKLRLNPADYSVFQLNKAS